MEIRYITDTDFVKSRIEGDEYSLIYGIIQHTVHSIELRDRYLYNLAAVLCVKQETKVLRIVKAKQWIGLLDEITNILLSLDKRTLVSIPFCNIYGYEVNEIIASFQLSRSVLNEFLSANFENLEVIDYINRCYPIQSLEDLFLNLIIEIETGMFEEVGSSDSFIVYDEMLRRGLKVNKSVICPSEHYDENLYYKYFISETKPKSNHAIEEENEENEIVKHKGYDIKRIAVLYYMLREVLADNKELLIKVANYAIDKDYILNNKANNSAYKYIHDTELLTDKAWKVEYIREQLERYNMEVPDELKDKKKTITKLT